VESGRGGNSFRLSRVGLHLAALPYCKRGEALGAMEDQNKERPKSDFGPKDRPTCRPLSFLQVGEGDVVLAHHFPKVPVWF